MAGDTVIMPGHKAGNCESFNSNIVSIVTAKKAWYQAFQTAVQANPTVLGRVMEEKEKNLRTFTSKYLTVPL